MSDTVIRQMKHLHQDQRPDLTFEKMDATNMDYSDDSFNVILDKGTLDAMMPDESTEVVANVHRLFSEIGNLIRNCGS